MKQAEWERLILCYLQEKGCVVVLLMGWLQGRGLMRAWGAWPSGARSNRDAWRMRAACACPLARRSYKEAEQAFQRSSRLEDEHMALSDRLSAYKGVVEQLVAHFSSENETTAYVESFERLASWVDNALDMYKARAPPRAARDASLHACALCSLPGAALPGAALPQRAWAPLQQHAHSVPPWHDGLRVCCAPCRRASSLACSTPSSCTATCDWWPATARTSPGSCMQSEWAHVCHRQAHSSSRQQRRQQQWRRLPHAATHGLCCTGPAGSGSGCATPRAACRAAGRRRCRRCRASR